MSVPGHEAEKKFWKTPELLEGLLTFLDAPSILELANAHPLTRGILKGTYNWGRFVRRSCPFPPPTYQTSNSRFEEKTEQKVAELRPMIAILQLIGSPQLHLMALLDLICERFPAPMEVNQFGPENLKVTTQVGHTVHYVSALGFVLLELVEAALGSSQLVLGSVLVFSIREPLTSALKSRMMRQEEKISQVDAYFLTCQTLDQAEAVRTLVQLTERFGFRRLAIRGAIGEGGWAALAEAFRVLPPMLLDGGPEDPRGFQALVADSKNLMLDGRRDDVRAVWNAIPGGSHLMLLNPQLLDGTMMIFAKGSEEEWVRLEMYLDIEDAVGAQNENPEN